MITNMVQLIAYCTSSVSTSMFDTQSDIYLFSLPVCTVRITDCWKLTSVMKID